MKKVIIAWLGVAAVMACTEHGSGGGGSGVEGTKRLADLDATEAQRLCTYMFATLPSRMVMCGNTTLRVGIQSVDECIATKPSGATCAATVDDAEACAEAEADRTDADWCSDQPLPAACAPFLTTGCRGGVN